MKKINQLSALFFAAFLAISSSACSSNANSNSSAPQSSVQVSEQRSDHTESSTAETSEVSKSISETESSVIVESSTESAEEPSENGTTESSEEEQESSEKESSQLSDVKTVQIRINGYSFKTELENNTTANAFYNTLPMTVSMTELNGNEKYTDLNYSLLKDAPSNPKTINEGDLMLFRDSTVVLFYDTFDTEYSYVKLGKILDTTELKAAMGSGDVSVEFSK